MHCASSSNRGIGPDWRPCMMPVNTLPSAAFCVDFTTIECRNSMHTIGPCMASSGMECRKERCTCRTHGPLNDHAHFVEHCSAHISAPSGFRWLHWCFLEHESRALTLLRPPLLLWGVKFAWNPLKTWKVWPIIWAEIMDCRACPSTLPVTALPATRRVPTAVPCMIAWQACVHTSIRGVVWIFVLMRRPRPSRCVTIGCRHVWRGKWRSCSPNHNWNWLWHCTVSFVEYDTHVPQTSPATSRAVMGGSGAVLNNWRWFWSACSMPMATAYATLPCIKIDWITCAFLWGTFLCCSRRWTIRSLRHLRPATMLFDCCCPLHWMAPSEFTLNRLQPSIALSASGRIHSPWLPCAQPAFCADMPAKPVLWHSISGRHTPATRCPCLFTWRNWFHCWWQNNRLITSVMHACRFSTCQPTQMWHLTPIDSNWFMLICYTTAPAFCRSHCSWRDCCMMDTSLLNASELMAQQQVLETFKGLAPLLGAPQLSPNPREQKRSKHQHAEQHQPAQQAQVGTQQQQQLTNLTTLVQQLALLVLRHDRDLNQSRRADSFVLFFNRDPQGGLQSLLKATTMWQEQRKTTTVPLMTLRQHLTQCLFQDLMVKVIKISESTPEETLYQTSVQHKLIDAEGNWPFLEWDSKAKQMITSSKSISMTLMTQHVKELVEMFKNPDLVLSFRSLQTTPDSEICPWRLQLCPRADREWELLTRMSRSSVWTLLGTMLKPHALHQCGLADSIQRSMGHQPRKGKGKGKSKSNQQLPTQKWAHSSLCCFMFWATCVCKMIPIGAMPTAPFSVCFGCWCPCSAMQWLWGCILRNWYSFCHAITCKVLLWRISLGSIRSCKIGKPL